MPKNNHISKIKKSLEEVYGSVNIPEGRWWKRMLAFAGPAYMVAVGYMDPGNWATDIAGGASFGYKLVWVLLLSNVMAVLLQTLSARLGLVTGRDLAQACRDAYPSSVRWVLFILCEIAIAACDLAELLGTAIGLSLLFKLPVLWGVILTGFDVFLLLIIQRFGIRKMEGFIVSLISVIGLCFILEIFLSSPDWSGVARGFIPSSLSGKELYIAIGIIGATVMPHNLYLHSSLVQTRDVQGNEKKIGQACRFNLIDSVIALNGAFFVNAAILVLSAAAFWQNGIIVTEIGQAHSLLDNVLGSKIAPVAFALALLCAGQSSTLTGTLAGQITMEGFLHFRMRPWLRRLITRLTAILPAVLVISLTGEEGTYKLLILSQVILSLQLPFAVVPLIRFTGSRQKMGPFASSRVIKILSGIAAAIIIILNVSLVYGQIVSWAGSSGPYRWIVLSVTVPVSLALGLLLLWMLFRKEDENFPMTSVSADKVCKDAISHLKLYKRIGVALEANEGDTFILSEAIALAKTHKAELILIHIVEGVGGQWYGEHTGDYESRNDDIYLKELSEKLRKELIKENIPDVKMALGYGDVPIELVRVAKDEKIDFLVIGSHGHKGLSDLWHGHTIPTVRHELEIPLIAVKVKGDKK